MMRHATGNGGVYRALMDTVFTNSLEIGFDASAQHFRVLKRPSPDNVEDPVEDTHITYAVM
eukprot:8130394-Pyramimonas_sp.AAC.2